MQNKRPKLVLMVSDDGNDFSWEPVNHHASSVEIDQSGKADVKAFTLAAASMRLFAIAQLALKRDG